MSDDNDLKGIYQRYLDNAPIFTRARELIAKYGTVKEIPENIILESEEFDEAELLACCLVIEEDIADEKLIH